MPDEADLGNEQAEHNLAQALAAIPREIPPGEPGECSLCELFSPRLVGGVCAPCRDLYKLP